jgi:hypothetical protein
MYDVRRGEGRDNRSLTLVLEGNNPRFPWKPSTTMLTYRLTRTTEEIGVHRDEHRTFSPWPAAPDHSRNPAAPNGESSRTTVRLRPKAQ